MAGMQVGSFLRSLRLRLGALHSDQDACLLERFVQNQDADAFAALLGRYGPLVLRVCRQLLSREEDVEDAFQATFLVLARKAGSIRQGELLAAWLHAVACRAAREIRARSVRPMPDLRSEPMTQDRASAQAEQRELDQLLHEEVERLPVKYRRPIVACYLDGQTHEQAAERLGWPVGTVRTRLSQGRDLLHTRLVRRGVALSITVLLGRLAEASASVTVPAALSDSTLRAALLVAAGGDPVGAGVSAGVAAVVQGVLHSMWLSKLKIVGVVVLALVLAGGALGYYATTRAASAVASAPATPVKKYILQGRFIKSVDQAPPADRTPDAWIGPEINKLTNKRIGQKDPAHLDAISGWLVIDEKPLSVELGSLKVSISIQSVGEEEIRLQGSMSAGNANAIMAPRIANRPGGRVAERLTNDTFLVLQLVEAAADKAAAAKAEPAAKDWEKLFENEDWYKQTKGTEQVFKGKLEAIPNADAPSTLQRTSYYKLGDRTIYTGAKKVAALDKLVGKEVEMRGKPVDMNLEGQSLKEIWPAAVRPAAGK
ncbi:MAG: sigma-70 family RNA polymerase sigma factor [Planctomycetia bacterium]|nr:sigma-70 family RNA polymerase sigma factor [Planctomycetia bacterium]